MVVVDSSAFIAAITGERPGGAWVYEQLSNQPFVSTHLMPVEVYNTLRRMEISGELTPADAASARREFSEFTLELYPFAPYAERVWALRRNISAYDAWYVALAESLDCPLVTVDHRLSRASGPECVFALPPDA